MARPRMHGDNIYKTTLYLDREVMAEARRLWPGYDTSRIIRDLMRRAVRARADRLQLPLEQGSPDPENVLFQV